MKSRKERVSKALYKLGISGFDEKRLRDFLEHRMEERTLCDICPKFLLEARHQREQHSSGFCTVCKAAFPSVDVGDSPCPCKVLSTAYVVRVVGRLIK